jgi:glycosyltransferase involved in cell wall biosynthesis
VRILHVVTLVSPDAAFGGPMRVALHQCRSLAALGHEVVLAAAGRGFDGPMPEEFDGVPVRLFPATATVPGTGFSGLRARGLHRWLRAHVDDFDVVHLHLTRDLVTLPTAMFLQRHGTPYVVQPHGQIDPSTRLLARLLDPVMTRPALRRAAAVLCITAAESVPLRAVAGPDLVLRELPNAVDDALVEGEPEREILFLARLAERKRPVVFARAAVAVAPELPGWRFTLVGPDEGERAAVEEVIASSGAPISLEPAVAPEDVPARMRRCAVYVLPAVDEPFGMTVIEAMAQERPVVVTDSCGLADVVAGGAGLVVDDSVAALAGAMRALATDAGLRTRLGTEGRRLVRQQYTLDAAAGRLEGHYAEVLG